MSWPTLIESYLAHRKTRLTPRTVHLYGKELWTFARFCGERPPGQVEPEDLMAYRQELRCAGRSQGTVYKTLGCLRAFFRWAYKQSHVLLDPGRELLELRLPRSLGRVLTAVEVETLLALPNPCTRKGLRNLAVLETFYGTGVRLDECRRLDLADLDLQERCLSVHHGKGDRGRRIPFGRHLADVLSRYLGRSRPRYPTVPGNEEALFLSYQGRRPSCHALYHLVATYGRRARLGPLSPHRLRHAYATHLLEGGADLCTIKALLGHRSVLTTQHYTAIRPVELFRTVRRYHPRARRRTAGPGRLPTRRPRAYRRRRRK